MFKKLSLLALSAFAFMAGASAQNQAILQGTIGDRTLNADTCYYLKGCVTVHNGTLNIPAGTRIFGIDDNNNLPGTLIIDTTGYIIANGTPTNPIIFTSGKAVNFRAAGDWGGIVIAGTSTANQNCNGSAFTIEGPCTPIFAGGSNAADSSGSLTYVQIHYAGRAVQLNNELNSLTMCAVGSKTQIHHIQVTNALDDAYEWFGGTVNCHHLVAYNTLDDDFDTDFGYSGKVQFALALRLDTSKHDISKSHGIESDNNNDAASDYTCGTYKTSPVFSNVTLIGPRFCGINTVNAEFESALQIRRNSRNSVYNSIFTGWPAGLRVDDRNPNPVTAGFDPTANNTLTNLLNLGCNTFANTGTAATSTGNSWTANGCSISVLAWLGLASSPAATCKETGNQPLTVNPSGFSSTLCGNFCSAAPDFTATAGNVSATVDFTSPDVSTGFDVVTYRGAFGATDWTIGWTAWCPQTVNYNCGTAPQKPAAPKVTFVPNPSNSATYAVFNAEQTGKVRISILDKVSGKALRTVNSTIEAAGEQHVSFDASGLREGVYFVQVELSNGMVISGQLSVR